VALFSDDSLGDSAADHRLFSLARIIGHVSIFLGREKKDFGAKVAINLTK